MKKITSLLLLALCLVSCSNREEPTIQEVVNLDLDFTFVESGSMARSTGAEVYNDFYEKYIKTKVLTPTTYSLTFKHKETGARSTINGFWNNKGGIRLVAGEYEVTGTSAPKKYEFGEWSDSVYLSFNETVSIKKDDTKLTLKANYDSFLLIFDKENKTVIYCENYKYGSSSSTKIGNDENLYWLFIQQTYHNNTEADFYLDIRYKDQSNSRINLYDMPFVKGKYYYFNDMTYSFDIPPMESEN